LGKGTDQDLETPLIDYKDCAYAILTKTALAVLQAYNQGIISGKKNQFLAIYIQSV
jgi:hypothetical protein